MGNQQNDGGKRDDAWWLDQWKQSDAVLNRRQQARERSWPGYVKEQTGRARYAAWLVLPCNASDYGMRPLPSGTPYWASPFIWAESPSPSGNPVAGAENHIVTRLFNLGAATAAPTKVDFFWCDPSVGLGAADAHFIGTEYVEVQPMTSQVVRCATPWIPSYLNDGHECVFVQCDNHVLDPLLLPFQPWADRHVGQRNMHVLQAVAQAFHLWAPAGIEGVRAELRVTAMRAALRALPDRRLPAARFFGEAAARLLAGLAPAQVTARREAGNAAAPPPQVTGKLLDAQDVIESARLTETIRRPTCGGEHPADCCGKAAGGAPQPGGMPARDTGAGNQHLLFIDGEPGTARQIALQLRAIPLQLHELVVLNVTLVSAGLIRGGYVLVLVHPDWLKDSPTHSSKENPMQQPGADKGNDLRDLVIEQFPQAQLTLEVARTLQSHLPIASADALEQAAKYGTIGGHPIAAGMIERMGIKQLLPIQDSKDLVRKIAGVLTVAAHQGGQGTPVGDPVANVATGLLRRGDAAGPSIPTHHFSGGSVFGFTRAKGE
ncbi:hypothetical protein [Ralstonia solanacearum]|uniref:hypothetical protein n=1 Tax=Ralstonia solanacearum TaxID=305 RepID=UPI0001817536|nr:hypothetical protein [Ralstonia solanacearum]EUJ12106.1 hypothetical protein RSP673_22800 [Ralstonia solanacearum P673]MCL9844145.1 hypothetical protein [Ralstonia solanacearum]MCL9850015.1 hypothetical protein [Ralstonia solanacearum]MCL9856300.1 hypothetical protein [Ralstonia solanacearum]MCL9860540.1 hypothetical protein [Ralstonia solanacearum]